MNATTRASPPHEEGIVCSICIANYNGIALIDACIESVRAQDCRFPVEIIVHDDASTDASVEYLRARHPDVRLIVSKENVGFCVANNRMAAAARGEYLLLLNNDAALFPDALAVLLDEAVRLQHPAILSLPQYDADTGELLDVGSLLDPFLNPVPNRDPASNDVGMVAGACLWIPKILWDEMGGFPEWFGSIAEDLYLCCRARLAGYPVRALGLSGYRHRVGWSFGGGKVANGQLVTTFRRRALSERNKTFSIAITYPLFLLVSIMPVHLLLLLVEGVALTVIRRQGVFLSKIYLPVFAAIFRQQKEIWSLRQMVQDQRRTTLINYLAPMSFWPHKLRMLIRHGVPRIKSAS